jgi:hypothetical protein
MNITKQMRRKDAEKVRKFVNKNFPVSIFAICLSLSGCQSFGRNYPVDFVDRNAVFAFNKEPKPLMLVVGITESGKLSLNKIETGTISDAALLSEKLEIIFDDREKAGISEREVVIDPQGNVKNEDLEKLIQSLANAKAAPIRVIKNNL